MGGYPSYEALVAGEFLGVDYDILFRPGRTGVMVMAPHGGRIEPGTDWVAGALAGARHGYYGFRGIKPEGNLRLRIPSHFFDEPRALELASNATAVVTVHGCRGVDPCVSLGGRDEVLKAAAAERLSAAGFAVAEDTRFAGRRVTNLCNRGLSGKGLQLELSAGLRGALLSHADWRGDREEESGFGRFIGALRGALAVAGPLGV